MLHVTLAQYAPPGASWDMVPVHSRPSQKPPCPTVTVPPARVTPVVLVAQNGEKMTTAAVVAFKGACAMRTYFPVVFG